MKWSVAVWLACLLALVSACAQMEEPEPEPVIIVEEPAYILIDGETCGEDGIGGTGCR